MIMFVSTWNSRFSSFFFLAFIHFDFTSICRLQFPRNALCFYLFLFIIIFLLFLFRFGSLNILYFYVFSALNFQLFIFAFQVKTDAEFGLSYLLFGLFIYSSGFTRFVYISLSIFSLLCIYSLIHFDWLGRHRFIASLLIHSQRN